MSAPDPSALSTTSTNRAVRTYIISEFSRIAEGLTAQLRPGTSFSDLLSDTQTGIARTAAELIKREVISASGVEDPGDAAELQMKRQLAQEASTMTVDDSLIESMIHEARTAEGTQTNLQSEGTGFNQDTVMTGTEPETNLTAPSAASASGAASTCQAPRDRKIAVPGRKWRERVPKQDQGE
ncbi:hypothetical protein I317_01593 [Kwoniella heveanensis CBS 569]|nr:hypothetical protein I317_01593 [Kwoniella heveanensis CBS 569]